MTKSRDFLSLLAKLVDSLVYASNLVSIRLIECPFCDSKQHAAFKRFAIEQPNALTLQILHDLRHEQDIDRL
jgi:hypothetical protein